LSAVAIWDAPHGQLVSASFDVFHWEGIFTMRFAIVALTALCIGVAAQAKAEAISGPFTTTTPIASTLTDWTGSLAFPQFDANLGTLLSVQLDLTGHFSTVLTVTNTGSSSSTGTTKTELQVSVQDGGNNLWAPELDLFSSQYAFTDLPAGDSITSGTISKTGSSTDVYTLASVLAEFTGTGSIVLPASTYTQTWIGYNGGNTNASQVTNAELTGSVTYRYAPVPEPSTLALLGIGAFGLLFGIRRDRKS
jgi:hypothetical protein